MAEWGQNISKVALESLHFWEIMYRALIRILMFLIAMGADYSFYVKSIEPHARAFLALNILAIGRVDVVW